MKKSFFKAFNKGVSNVLTTQLASEFASKAGPASEKLQQLISEKDFDSLVRFEFDYNLDWDPVSLYCARQCVAFFSKRDDIDLGIDRKELAFSKFIESELCCRLTNERVIRARSEQTSARVASVLYMAQRKIERILGDLPSLSELDIAFGPGANTNVRKTTSSRWKLAAKPACSADMASSVFQLLAEIPSYTSFHGTNIYELPSSDGVDRTTQDDPIGWSVPVEVHDGNLMFVPKDAKIDRAIIVEPSMNSLLQKGYGSHIKRRLMKHGVNLYDQSINRGRAREGSMHNRLMTVDLSSASDTIAKELVSELLPLDWYLALNECRTSTVVYSDKNWDYRIRLEKFSSMGNGFTFELESLIFYALTQAVCHYEGVKPDVTVFGDDIICPSIVYDALEEVFSFCGFSINKSKSFRDGNFRESCGADYFKGVNVRPFYQRTTWSWATLTSFHNFLVRSGWSVLFPDLLEYTVQGRPDSLRNYGPDGFGDGHLLGEWSAEPFRRDRGWGGYTFKTWVSLPLRKKDICGGDSLLPSYSVYRRMSASESFDPYVLRGTRGERCISVYTLGRF